jgi:HKD family nuclease
VRLVDGVTDGLQGGLAGWFERSLPEARDVGLRTAFLTLVGLEIVLPRLEAVLARGGSLSVICGGQERQSEALALAGLLELSDRYPGRVELVVVGPSGVRSNSRSYFVRNPEGRVLAYVGSADLTCAGLRDNHETGVLLDSTTEPGVVQELLKAHEVLLKHSDVQPVTRELAAGLAAVRRGGRVVVPRVVAERVEAALDHMEARGTRVTKLGRTGFADLDALTGGLRPGSLTVVGGRPGIGKSVFALDLCREAAVHDSRPVALFDLENGPDETCMRLFAAEARVGLHHVRGGSMSDEDWNRVARRMADITSAPLVIGGFPGMTAPQLYRQAEQVRCEQGGLDLVVVDCLQQLAPHKPANTREREIAEQVYLLKQLAHDLAVAVVVTAQLNRGPLERSGHVPVLGDLRDSDTINHVADTVILLHRADAYEKESPRAGEADFIVAKHRNGATATITVAFQGHYSRFVDLTQ